MWNRFLHFQYFTGLDNPVNDYLRLVLHLLELAVPHLRLSTADLLVCERCSHILIPRLLCIMSRENTGFSSDNSNSHPVSPIADAPKGHA